MIPGLSPDVDVVVVFHYRFAHDEISATFDEAFARLRAAMAKEPPLYGPVNGTVYIGDAAASILAAGNEIDLT